MAANPPRELQLKRSNPPDALPPALEAQGPVLQSHMLLGQRQAVDIEHNGQRYRLQSTKAGKLILTK